VSKPTFKLTFQFQPISHSWVAVHPNAESIVQFIGEAFFGTFFPTLWYRRLLKTLYFDRGCTIVVIPYTFRLSHWKSALQILEEQYRIRRILKTENALVRDNAIYDDDRNYYWLAHGVGAKYVVLLEAMSVERNRSLPRQQLWETIKNDIEQQVALVYASKPALQHRRLQEILKPLDRAFNIWYELQTDRTSQSPLIRDRASVLLSPNFSSLRSIIPSASWLPGLGKFLASILDPIFVKPLQKLCDTIDAADRGSTPTQAQTHETIEYSDRVLDLFNLTAVLSFVGDRIAGDTQSAVVPRTQEKSDLYWFVDRLYPKLNANLTQPLHHELHGIRTGLDPHFAPLGIRQTTSKVVDRWVVTMLERLETKRSRPSPLPLRSRVPSAMA